MSSDAGKAGREILPLHFHVYLHTESLVALFVLGYPREPQSILTA